MNNLLLVITGSVSARLFYELQTEFEKSYNVKVLFTESAKRLLRDELYCFFNHVTDCSPILSNKDNELLEKFGRKGIKYRNYDERLKKYSCSFYYDKNCKDSFDHECYRYEKTNQIEHIDLVNLADKLVIAPCTANTLNKLSQGITDNFVMSVLNAFVGTSKPLYKATAMNTYMYNNFATQRSILELKENRDAIFIDPTVKKLACGNFGIGALADISTIINIVNENYWNMPISYDDLNDLSEIKQISSVNEKLTIKYKTNFRFSNYLPDYDEIGSFGFKRKYDIHNGVDIYCKDNCNVIAVEDGEVVAIKPFTVKQLGYDCVNDTWTICIKGNSGVVCYGEMQETFNFNVGDKVKAGDIIGKVKAVLKENNVRVDIRNHNNAMLHVQLFSDYTNDEQLLHWYPNEDRNKQLLDPTPYLKNVKEDILK